MPQVLDCSYSLTESFQAFLIDVFARPQNASQFQSHEPAELIGSCYMMPKHLFSTSGRIRETIIASSKFEAIGEVTMQFLVIHAMPEVKCDFAVTFAKHWKPHWKGLDVGHRGLGNSFTKQDQ
jgi:glycerophosphocholine phosphodiesterase GPCPD1